MHKINSSASLRAAIIALETKREEEGKVMKIQFHQAYESVKPINIIKSTFKEFSGMPDLSTSIISSSAGLTAGYLSQALFVGVKNDSLKKLFSTVFVFGISTLVAHNPKVVKSVGNGILTFIKILPEIRFQKTKPTEL
jgi:hypothetical protein